MKRIANRVVLILAFFASAALSCFFEAYLQISIAIICLLAASCLLERSGKAKLVLAASVAVALIAASLVDRFSVQMIAGLLSMAVLNVLIILNVSSSRKTLGRKRPWAKRAVGITGWVLDAIVFLFALLFFVLPFCADGVAAQMTGTTAESSQAKTVNVETRDDGVTVTGDLEYPSSYSNNYLTVYATSESEGTVFYIHGGGYVSGSKDSEYEQPIIDEWLAAGFNVVAVDYALAPENRYPAQVTECNDALAYVIDNAGDFGIDASKIVICGDSAGGQIAGQLTNLQTNEDYASSMGIEPAMQNGLKPAGFMSMCGLLSTQDCGHTGFPLTNVFFNLCGIVEFDDVDYASDSGAEQSSVLAHATADFPATYLSDGNVGTFTSQGKEFEQKLEDLGVSVTSNFPESPTLFHIWEFSLDTESGADNVKGQVAFLHSCVE